MKKIKYLIVSIISVFLFNVSAYAASGSLSVSSSSVYVGDSFTVSVNLYSMAAWVVKVNSTGPVSGCSINEASDSGDGHNINKTISATCTATGTGTINIRLSGDITDEGYNTVYLSDSRNVTVTQRPAPAPDPVPVPSGGGGNNNNNNNPVNNPTTDDRSGNNNLKELSVDGYELTKVDNNNYTLTVPYDVESINVGGKAEDSKANVSGTGKHDLNIGENNIEIVVTAENGSQNKIIIKVTRKDGYYIEDLDSVLKNDKLKDTSIIVNSDTKITSEDLKKIKDSKKTINFNYYDENKSLLYSWIIDGSRLKDTDELNIPISFDSKNKKEILKLSNYADGIFVDTQVKNSTKGRSLKIYVGNKYSDGDLVNIYSYKTNSGKLVLVENKVKVKDGFVQFEVEDDSDYFVTMSTINNSSDNDKICIKKSMLWIPAVIGGLLLLLIIIILIVKKKKKKDISDDEII